jgi:uncharacterized membrane protein HdeD (DUF308 family)
MSTNEPNAVRLERSIVLSMHKHWRLCLIEGVLLMILGLVALIVPRTGIVNFEFGWLFLLSGITGLVTSLLVREAPGVGRLFVAAILAIAAGILMVLSPTNVLSLTLILVLFFVLEGVASIMFAYANMRDVSGQWVWMLGSGIVDLFLAALILIGLPGSAKWALGLLTGVNLITGGVALIAMALQGRAIISNNAT